MDIPWPQTSYSNQHHFLCSTQRTKRCLVRLQRLPKALSIGTRPMVRDLALVFLLGFSFIFQQCNCYNGVVVSNTCNVMPREYPVGSRGGPGRGSTGRSPPDTLPGPRRFVSIS